MISPIEYKEKKLYILDQTLLPAEERYIELKCKEDVWEAIHSLRVRGAPAIGVASAFGFLVSLRAELEAQSFNGSAAEYLGLSKEIGDYLISSRPTAVNLEWAIKRMQKRLDIKLNDFDKESLLCDTSLSELEEALTQEARAIMEEDIASCKAMGEHGLSLLDKNMGILTHWNLPCAALPRTREAI